jgi:hypothetical protein
VSRSLPLLRFIELPMTVDPSTLTVQPNRRQGRVAIRGRAAASVHCAVEVGSAIECSRGMLERKSDSRFDSKLRVIGVIGGRPRTECLRSHARRAAWGRPRRDRRTSADVGGCWRVTLEAALEMPLGASPRGFESHPFRHHP